MCGLELCKLRHLSRPSAEPILIEEADNWRKESETSPFAVLDYAADRLNIGPSMFDFGDIVKPGCLNKIIINESHEAWPDNVSAPIHANARLIGVQFKLLLKINHTRLRHYRGE